MVTMRQQFVKTATALLEQDPRIVVLLGDISVHAFGEAMARWPQRCINVGINEQAMVSVGAGLARAGFYPIMHTIAPFLVERAFEQIKIDFGYQHLAGAFVSVGASYDYSTMGCTHHCPGDVALMLTVPGMEIYAPGHSDEVAELLPKIADGALAYVRLSDAQNPFAFANPAVGMANVMTTVSISGGTLIIAAGPTVALVPESANYFFLGRLDRMPRDLELSHYRKFLVLEPFYTGTLTHLLTERMDRPVTIRSVGVPRRFLSDYGSREDFDGDCGLTAGNVKLQLQRLMDA